MSGLEIRPRDNEVHPTSRIQAPRKIGKLLISSASEFEFIRSNQIFHHHLSTSLNSVQRLILYVHSEGSVNYGTSAL